MDSSTTTTARYFYSDNPHQLNTKQPDDMVNFFIKPNDKITMTKPVLLSSEGGAADIYTTTVTKNDEKDGYPLVMKKSKHILNDPLLVNEIAILEKLNEGAGDTPNCIVKYHGYRKHPEEGSIELFLEHIPGKSLDKASSELKVDAGMRQTFLKDMRDALLFIAGKGVTHMDVFEKNMMVMPSGHGKLIDFGGSQPKIVSKYDDEKFAKSLKTVGIEDS